MRIALTISSLAGGGAERSLVTLAGGLRDRGHHVAAITEADPTVDAYLLPPSVTRESLSLASTTRRRLPLLAPARRLLALRRAILRQRPDAVISYMVGTNIAVLLSLAGTGIPVIATEHLDPSQVALGPLWRRLHRPAYRRAARVVSVSRGVDRCYAWLPRTRRAVIPNPLTVPAEAESPAPGTLLPTGRRRIVAMGRLAHAKGLDMLLEAFAQVAPKYPEWDVLILGEGPLRESLTALRDRLGLGSRVAMPGFVDPPFAILRHSDVFVLSSRAEGLPYALVEAMACGLPAIAMDCPSGPAEIVSNGVDGLLVPNGDVRELARAMDRLMGDEDLRHEMGARARAVQARYALPTVLDLWGDLLADVCCSC